MAKEISISYTINGNSTQNLIANWEIPEGYMAYALAMDNTGNDLVMPYMPYRKVGATATSKEISVRNPTGETRSSTAYCTIYFIKKGCYSYIN